MNNENILRFITVVLFLSLLSIGMLHRLRAHNSQDHISRREEGAGIMILLRLAGFSAWIGLVIYMINPHWMSWSSVALYPQVRWIGAGIIVAVIPFFYWMFQSLGKNVTDTVTIRKQHQLVTHGPYRWVRHPMYLLAAFTFSGFSLLIANWFIASAGLIALTFLIIRTPIEEAKLIEKFGDEYRAYMKKTGKFFPKLHS